VTSISIKVAAKEHKASSGVEHIQRMERRACQGQGSSRHPKFERLIDDQRRADALTGLYRWDVEKADGSHKAEAVKVELSHFDVEDIDIFIKRKTCQSS
jgi:hypothetical protein